MATQPSYRLGDLQLSIMKVLWGTGPASVAGVQSGLGGGLAYTTVATMLRKMEDRGLVCHDVQGRKFIYRPAVTGEAVTRSMANDMVDRLFQGSPARAVRHLFESREIGPTELAELERLIQQLQERKRQ